MFDFAEKMDAFGNFASRAGNKVMDGADSVANYMAMQAAEAIREEEAKEAGGWGDETARLEGLSTLAEQHMWPILEDMFLTPPPPPPFLL